MMNVVVFGASGRVGKVVVETLIEKGCETRAFIHRANLYEDSKLVEIVKGDILRLEDVQRAVDGTDAVISVVSSWKAKDKNVLSIGIDNILKSTEQTNIRIVSLTGNLAKSESEKWPFLLKSTRLFMSVFASGVLKDAEGHISKLEASSADWVVVRSPIITGSKKCRGYSLSSEPKIVVFKSVSCVAGSLVDIATNKNSNFNKLLFLV